MNAEEEQQLFERFLKKSELKEVASLTFDGKIRSFRRSLAAFTAGLLLLFAFGIWQKEWVFTKVVEWMYPPGYIKEKIQGDLRDDFTTEDSGFENKFLDKTRKSKVIMHLRDLSEEDRIRLKKVGFDELPGIGIETTRLHNDALNEINILTQRNKELTSQIDKLKEDNNALRTYAKFAQALKRGDKDSINLLTDLIRKNEPSLFSPDLLVGGVDPKKIELELSKFIGLTNATNITTLSKKDYIDSKKIAAHIAITEKKENNLLPWLRKIQGIEPSFKVSLHYSKSKTQIKSIPVVSYSRKIGKSDTIEIRITQEAAKTLNIPYWESFQSSGSGIISLQEVSVQ